MLKQLKFLQRQNQVNSNNNRSLTDTVLAQSKGVVKEFFSLFLPLTALVGAGLITFYQLQSNLTRDEIASNERLNVELRASMFANRFSSIRADLMVIAAQNELQVLLDRTTSPETVQRFRSALAAEYLVVSQQKQQYDQIRFLDAAGQEVVRVNFNRGQPNIVPDEKLQNQSKRYWFQDTFTLQNAEIFVSPLDLNIDFGKIEQPLKPMIRFGTPVFDNRGNKRGVVVLNYLASEFLKDLAKENSITPGETLLLNAQGYWLKGMKPEDEWGFMFDERKNHTFANAFPAAWEQIIDRESGQFQTAEGLFTFTTIYPLLEVQGARSSTGSSRAFGSSQNRIEANSYYWKLVSYVPSKVLTQRSQATFNQLLFIFMGLTGLNAVGSWFLVQSRTQHRQSEQENKDLEQTLQELQRTQAQLVQSEKMSSLGQLVAGVAHEINNPVNFIHGNLKYTDEYTQNLLNLIQLYQKYYPNPVPEIQSEAEAVDLDFLQEDLPKMIKSMKVGADRIRQIVLSLRNFSRLDEAEFKAVDIHEGIESTLVILQHRLKARAERPAIEIIKEYENLPLVECYPGQLNQVFMNILANAIDALEEANAKRTYREMEAHPNRITIHTSLINSQWVQIAIADNGLGIPKHIQQHIFNPFFTTKPLGKGTGMGMSISYQIVTQKHGGKLEYFSTPGERTEFVIQIPIRQQIRAAV